MIVCLKIFLIQLQWKNQRETIHEILLAFFIIDPATPFDEWSDENDEIIDKYNDDFEWPPISAAKCTQTTKQKAMYGSMVFEPSLKVKPMTSFEVDIEWSDLKFHPTENTRNKGGVYVAYTMGLRDGPGGYFGAQIKNNGGNLLSLMFLIPPHPALIS